MKRSSATFAVTGLWLASTMVLACTSRQDEIARQLEYEKGEVKEKAPPPPEIPPHPMREKLRPLLAKLYPQNKLPAVTEADIAADEHNYELTPGVLAVIRLSEGLSPEQKVKAIIMGTAEADAWSYRSNARKPYADQIHRVKRGFGDDQKDLILKAYADLRLLSFFNTPEGQAAVGELPNDVKGIVQGMQKHYTENKEDVWKQWMDVKMYARRVVAGDEPFRSVLREIKKELGREEPPPRTWAESMDAPFKRWGEQIQGNEEFLTKVLNMRDLRDREEFLNDTHGVWAMQGSALVPEKAKKLKPDKTLGFAARREDLGGGYNDMTYIFSRSMSGAALKKAYIQSIIYGSLLHDFQMLATAGSDFAKRDADNVIDSRTAVVPDKYDPLYAKCGSRAAVDTFIHHYKNKFPILSDLSGSGDQDKVLSAAHECVIAGARGDIHVPPKDDEKDVEGPAPGSRLALYQMLARFENVDVNMAAMGSQEETEEDKKNRELEAKLKALRQKHAEQNR